MFSSDIVVVYHDSGARFKTFLDMCLFVSLSFSGSNFFSLFNLPSFEVSVWYVLVFGGFTCKRHRHQGKNNANKKYKESKNSSAALPMDSHWPHFFIISFCYCLLRLVWAHRRPKNDFRKKGSSHPRRPSDGVCRHIRGHGTQPRGN